MSRKSTSLLPRSKKRQEVLDLEQLARKDRLESLGKSFKVRLFLRKACRLIFNYTVIVGLIWVMVWLWKDFFLKYEWLPIDTVTFHSNGLFHPDQALKVMNMKSSEDVFSVDAKELERRLLLCPAIRRASVKYQLSPESTLIIDVDARVPIAWIECPELGIHPGDFKYGVLVDKEGVMFPSIQDVHQPYLNNKTLPSIELRTPASGMPEYGIAQKELLPPIKLLGLLDEATASQLPTVRSVSVPNDWSFCVLFADNCRVTFAHYGLERQVDRLLTALEHARRTNRKISTINLIPDHNIPVTFDGEYESIPLAEPLD